MSTRVLVMIATVAASASAHALSVEERVAVYDSYALEAKSDFEHAAQKMASVYEKNRSDLFVNLRLGYLFSYAKKYKNSVEHYEAAAKIAPRALDPWLGLSALYVNLADYTHALTASAEVLKRDSGNYYGLLRTTISQIKLKQYAEALPKVEEALKLYPMDPIFLEQKGFLLVTAGKTSAATESLNLLLLISPQNAYAKSILEKQ